MSLQLQLQEDMKQAMRDRDALKLGVIRFLKAEIKNVEIDNGLVDDAGVHKIIARQIKQIQEACEQFIAGGRPELAEEEQKKLGILQAYLPEQLSEEAVRTIIAAVVASVSVPSLKTVMPQVMSQVAGKADGRMVAQLVQAALQAAA